MSRPQEVMPTSEQLTVTIGATERAYRFGGIHFPLFIMLFQQLDGVKLGDRRYNGPVAEAVRSFSDVLEPEIEWMEKNGFADTAERIENIRATLGRFSAEPQDKNTSRAKTDQLGAENQVEEKVA